MNQYVIFWKAWPPSVSGQYYVIDSLYVAFLPFEHYACIKIQKGPLEKSFANTGNILL